MVTKLFLLFLKVSVHEDEDGGSPEYRLTFWQKCWQELKCWCTFFAVLALVFYLNKYAFRIKKRIVFHMPFRKMYTPLKKSVHCCF